MKELVSVRILRYKEARFFHNKETRLLRNKKAGEKYLSIWWFLVLILIGAGIVLSVALFYSAEINVREVEANFLAGRILDCLVEYGKLDSMVLDSSFNADYVFNKCKLSKDAFGSGENFGFKIILYDAGNELISSFLAGVNFEGECKIEERMRKAIYYPRCDIKEFPVSVSYDDKLINNIRKEFAKRENTISLKKNLNGIGITKMVDKVKVFNPDFINELDTKIGYDDATKERFLIYAGKLYRISNLISNPIISNDIMQGKLEVFTGLQATNSIRWREVNSGYIEKVIIKVVGGSNQFGRKIII